MAATLERRLRDKAIELGFDVVAITTASLDARVRQNLADYIARSYHGDMAWLAASFARRADPRSLWPEARSAVVLGMSYAP
jgi:epoxyqueuosine reductase